jgi:hypothetical protein
MVAHWGPRVGDGGDSAREIALGEPQRERAPAAAEIEDTLSVRHTGALAGEREHGGFRVVQSPYALCPETAAVFEMPSEDQAIEVCRHFVLLRAGLRGVDRDAPSAELGDEPRLACIGGRSVACRLLAQPASQKRSHPETQCGFRQTIRNEDAVEPGISPAARRADRLRPHRSVLYRVAGALLFSIRYTRRVPRADDPP